MTQTIDEHTLLQAVGPLIDAQPGHYDVAAILGDLIQTYDLTGDAPAETIESIGDGLWDIVLRHALPDIMTRDQVATYWGIDPDAVRSTLRRHDVPVDSRTPGRGGQSRYRADLVVAARAAAPGQGRRTDLEAGDPA